MTKVSSQPQWSDWRNRKGRGREDKSYDFNYHLVIFIDRRLLVLIESLASFQDVSVGVEFTLKYFFKHFNTNAGISSCCSAHKMMTNLSLLEVPDFLLHNSKGSLYRGLLWQRSPILQGLLRDSRRHLLAGNTYDGLTTDFSFQNSVLGMRRQQLLAAFQVAARGLAGWSDWEF